MIFLKEIECKLKNTDNNNYNEHGFTLVELIITIIIIGILASIGYVNYISIRSSAELATCLANQMTLETAQNLFFIEQTVNYDHAEYTSDFDDLLPYLKVIPKCKAGGEYIAHDDGTISCTIDEHIRF